jgi:hypothetical protein
MSKQFNGDGFKHKALKSYFQQFLLDLKLIEINKGGQ